MRDHRTGRPPAREHLEGHLIRVTAAHRAERVAAAGGGGELTAGNLVQADLRDQLIVRQLDGEDMRLLGATQRLDPQLRATPSIAEGVEEHQLQTVHM